MSIKTNRYQVNHHANYLTAFFIFCLLCLPSPLLASSDKLLPADEAYKISGDSLAPDLIQITWDIADKYYMYKDKIKISTDTPGIALGEPIFPKGKFKHDEFFGEMEVYRNQVNVSVPVSFSNVNPPNTISIIAKSQGCADRGVCYPPHTQKLSFPLMSFDQVSAPPPQESGGFLSALSQKLGLGKNNDSQNEFLPEDQVFIPSFLVNNGYIEAQWEITEGYYLYRDKFGFKVVSGEGISLSEPISSPGKKKFDEAFGDIEAYYDQVIIKVPYTNTNSEKSPIELEVKYQGCAEAGFCYPPITKVFPLTVPVFDTAAPAIITAAPPSTSNTSPEEFVTEQDRFAQSLANDNLFWVVLAFFGVGLLLAFTPCVFPMIPILSSIIVGQGPSTTTRQAFSLSLAYVLAMALTYTVIGIIAGLSGANLQAAFQNPWVLTTFSLVFVALALSMFGFYDLQLPNSLQSKLTQISNNQKGGTLIGAGIMGFLSALIVGPCVAAPLAGALIYISQTGDAMLGGVALFALSMGMGVPLLLIGTSAGKFLPKAGGWMNATKAVFGVLLLAVAIWMLERILPGPVTMFMWAVLAIISAVYLGALRRLEPEASGWQKLWQGTGLVLLAYGVMILLGAASGGNDPLQPLGKLSISQGGNPAFAATSSKLDFKYVKGLDELNSAIQQANSEGKPVMLDFYADWCVSCKEMEKYTFSDPSVHAALDKFVLLKTDVTENDDLDQSLMKNFGIFGPPAIMFFDQQGTERDKHRVVGFMKADEFVNHINRALPSI